MLNGIRSNLYKFGLVELQSLYTYLWYEDCKLNEDELVQHILAYVRQFIRFHKCKNECCIKFYIINSWYEYKKLKYCK